MKANIKLKCFLNISKFNSLLYLSKFITVKSAIKIKVMSKRLNFKELNFIRIYTKHSNPHIGCISDPNG